MFPLRAIFFLQRDKFSQLLLPEIIFIWSSCFSYIFIGYWILGGYCFLCNCVPWSLLDFLKSFINFGPCLTITMIVFHYDSDLFLLNLLGFQLHTWTKVWACPICLCICLLIPKSNIDFRFSSSVRDKLNSLDSVQNLPQPKTGCSAGGTCWSQLPSGWLSFLWKCKVYLFAFINFKAKTSTHTETEREAEGQRDGDIDIFIHRCTPKMPAISRARSNSRTRNCI